MRRRVIIIAGIVLALAALSVGGMLYAINRGMNARLGPVHRYSAAAGEQFLTEEHAVVIAREVMNRDGFPESAWKLMEDDRSKAPDGRPDRYMVRNVDDPNRAMIYFHCDNSPTPQRFVHLEFRNGQITAQGELGK
jgi:hypothetical protein